MKYYAEIKNGLVVSVFPWDVDNPPEYSDRIAVDVTDLSPMPGVNWTYDQATGQFSAPVDPDHIRVLVSLSGGDGLTPVGILNDGIQSIHADIRLSDKDGNLLPITDYFRIPIRRLDGTIKECVRIDFVSGIASIDYAATGETGFYAIEERDFEPQLVAPGVIWPLKLIGDSRFRIYRTL